MKRQFLHLLLILSFVSVCEAQDLGRVIIRNGQPGYPKFIVSLNGVRPTNEYNSSINFDYLDERNYRVKMLQAGSSSVLNFMVNNAGNYVSIYVVTKDNMGNYSLILESKTLLTGMEEPPTKTLTTTPTLTNVAVPILTIATAMADADYNDMVKSVKKESLESTKLEMAKTFFGSQTLSSVQVLGILKVFSLENSKVNFAKFAYSRTLDKQNYYKVYDAFSLSGSKKDMSEYIKNNP